MRIEIVAVGTELLLGQIADTNSAWLGEHLAAAGVSSHFHQAVGDNHDRMVLAFRTALARSDGIIVCGGLGPTQDDITREAIAEVMNVGLRRDDQVAELIRAMFNSRHREMSPSNLHQADVPDGRRPHPDDQGHRPRADLPGRPQGDLRGPRRPLRDVRHVRAGDPAGYPAADDRERRDHRGHRQPGAPHLGDERIRSGRRPGRITSSELDGPDRRATIAFLASGIEGIKVRVTVRADDREAAAGFLDAEETVIRRILSEAAGDVVFGVDDEAIEDAVARALAVGGLTLGLAESLTGGLASSRLVNVPGASGWFRGSVVSYASEVKFDILGVPEGPVVSEAAAIAMAEGARRVLGADVGLSITGVAGPDPQDDLPPGTVFVGLVRPGAEAEAVGFRVPGDRDRVRQYATIAALDLLRRRVVS